MNLPKDTVVLITGAGAGIGRAAALRFAESGARVVVTGRRPEPLKALAAGRENISSVLADAGNPDDARENGRNGYRTLGTSRYISEQRRGRGHAAS